MIILVNRCEKGPAPFRSDVIRCSVCDADCWLTWQRGRSVLELAQNLDHGAVLCSWCATLQLCNL